MPTSDQASVIPTNSRTSASVEPRLAGERARTVEHDLDAHPPDPQHVLDGHAMARLHLSDLGKLGHLPLVDRGPARPCRVHRLFERHPHVAVEHVGRQRLVRRQLLLDAPQDRRHDHLPVGGDQLEYP